MSASVFSRYARRYINFGYSPIPRWKDENGREHFPMEWSKYCLEVAPDNLIEKWSAIPDAMIALCCGYNGLTVFDADTKDEEQLTAIKGALPGFHVGRFGSKGFAMLARYEGGAIEQPYKFFNIHTGPRESSIKAVEIKGAGQNITVPPSLHFKTGEPYFWLNPHTGAPIRDVPALPFLPLVKDGHLGDIQTAMRPWATPPRPEPESKRYYSAPSNGLDTDREAERKRYEAWFEVAANNAMIRLSDLGEGQGRPTALFNAACAIGAGVHHGFITQAQLESALICGCDNNGLTKRDGRYACLASINSGLRWSRNDDLPVLPDREENKPQPRRKLNGNGAVQADHTDCHDGETPAPPPPKQSENVRGAQFTGDLGVAALEHTENRQKRHSTRIKEQQDNGEAEHKANGDARIDENQENGVKVGKTGRTEAKDAKKPKAQTSDPFFTESEIANIFVKQNPDRRYVHEWAKWIRFDGKVWRKDKIQNTWNAIRLLCDKLSAAATKRVKGIEKRTFVEGVQKMASADHRMAMTTDDWDKWDDNAKEWPINTPAGIINLKTGAIRPSRPEDYCLNITNISPDETCSIENWLKFLKTISDGDQEWIDFMQRVCGYCLTGSTREHAIFFGFGKGRNGKGTFIRALIEIMGDYHKAAQVETFLASKIDRHSTDLADLRGARLITASETHQGRRWDEPKIKSLSGGDRQKARFMRQDNFEFDMLGKLFFTGNHRPSIDSPDEAIKARMNLIPFTVTIPKLERDLKLFDEKLRPELPGIFAWMIEGCQIWLRDGLKAPECVREATDEYLSEEDTYGTWFKEHAKWSQTGWTNSSHLYNDWKAYAEARGEYAGKQKALTDYLRNHERDLRIKYFRTNKGKGFKHVVLQEKEQGQQGSFYDADNELVSEEDF